MECSLAKFTLMRIKLFIQLRRGKVLSDLILKVSLGFPCRIEISHPFNKILDASPVPSVVGNALYNVAIMSVQVKYRWWRLHSSSFDMCFIVIFQDCNVEQRMTMQIE